jgi:hypothetical protein
VRGGVFGGVYRISHRLPGRREIVLSGIIAALIFFWADWFHYATIKTEKDGQMISLSEVITFGKYNELELQEKINLHRDPGGGIRIKQGVNSKYEKLRYLFGYLFLSFTALRIFRNLTIGACYCENCKKYFKKTAGVHLKFSSLDELVNRLAKAEELGIETVESIEILIQPVVDSAPKKKKNLMLSLSSLKCSCGKQLINLSVSIFINNNWEKKPELCWIIELPHNSIRDITELLKKNKVA